MAERQRTTTVARASHSRAPRPPRPPQPMSATARNKLAIQTIVNTIAASDEKFAATAALEVMSERLSWDTALRQTVRQKYDELQALGNSRPSTSRTRSREPMPPLIRTPGFGRLTPLDVLDPYELVLDYGHDQLRNVLGRATKKNLKGAVALVQERNSGTKPANASTNQGLIDYIVQYVAPGY